MTLSRIADVVLVAEVKAREVANHARESCTSASVGAPGR
jgi:hypothetical protein